MNIVRKASLKDYVNVSGRVMSLTCSDLRRKCFAFSKKKNKKTDEIKKGNKNTQELKKTSLTFINVHNF